MPETVLHVHCGDSSAETLRQSDAPGDVIVWCDPLCEGPTPAGLADHPRRRVRAEYLAASTGTALKVDALAQTLAGQDAALARCVDYDEVVLWFDACLFDQAILIRQLDWFARQALGGTTLSLICVGEFPGFDRFKGLGELGAGQMASLFETRHQVTAAQIETAQRTWGAFCSEDPTEVERVIASDTSALPYLRDALARHLEQFPSARNGLSRLENEAVLVIGAGESKLGRIFANVSAKEERPFFGDTTLWACFDHLASGRTPALLIDGPGRLPLWDPPGRLDAWTVALTEPGHQMLEQNADWIELNGVDRWLGGVHLIGDDAAWRWDETAGRLVERTA